MAPVVEVIGKPLILGEGPFWDSSSQSLYFVDIVDGSIHRYDVASKKHTSAKLGSEPASLIIEVEGQKDKFVVSQTNDLYVVSWDGVSDKVSSKELLVKLEESKEGTRINDGKVDPAGRLWAGSMGPTIEGKDHEWVPEKGSLYRLNRDKTSSKQLANITLSNGLAWSSDNKKFYYIDTLKYRVDSYDYDNETGNISNEKTIFDLKENNIHGFPDGMTIDVEDKLWIAVFGSAKILRVDPTNGKLLTTISFPSLQITSACFGGPNYDELYVTSANIALTDEQLAKYPHAGSCFRVTNIGVKGFPSLPVKL
uniref:Regucalcin n=1 Tax=Clastoptera arizonana TaxID=38151 RepID=A0A1B6DWB3_9HEMI